MFFYVKNKPYIYFSFNIVKTHSIYLGGFFLFKKVSNDNNFLTFVLILKFTFVTLNLTR